MNLQRFVILIFALNLAVPQAASAQAEPPTIVLDLAPSQPEATRDPGAESEPVSDTETAPLIQLPFPTTPSRESGDIEESPVIPPRDRGEDVVPTSPQTWLLPLMPATHLTDVSQVGASQPAPGILRLTGEVVTIDLLIDLPQNASIPAKLLLTVRSTVNVLPDVAAVTVGINDNALVELPLNHLSGFETVEIPATGLMPGMNRVRLDLRQPHRIFCGPEASFNVWTEIDLARSGVSMEANTLSTDAAGLALAVSAQTATGRALPVLAADNEDASLLLEMAEKLTRVVDGQMGIEFRSFYGLEPPSPLSVALIASDRSHAEIRKSADGGLVLQVEHAGGQLPPLDDLLPKSPTLSNVVPALPPGITTNLAELGQADIIGNTRYFRHEVPFTLPENWLLLSSQKGRLRLNYGFADTLPEGATLLVKVNGQTIRLLPLDRNGGHMQEPLDIIFAANLLHAGRNDLVFEMMVPGNPPDAICPPRRADLLVVTNDSTLLVPPAPAMALAGISKPLSEVGLREVAVPQGVSDRGTLERIAVELGAGLAPLSRAPDGSVQLNVVGIGDIALVPLEQAGVSGRDLQEALLEKTPLSVTNSPRKVTEPARRYQFTEEDPQPVDRLDEDAEKSAVNDSSSRFMIQDWLAVQSHRVRSAAFMGGDESLAAWLRTQQGTALLIRPDAEESGELWLILGPRSSAQSVLKGLISLRDSGLAKGEAAILMTDGEWKVWTAVRPPELHEPLKLTNLRSVVGNYASWSPLLFTVTLLGFAMFSAIPALLFVLFTRRRGQL